MAVASVMSELMLGAQRIGQTAGGSIGVIEDQRANALRLLEAGFGENPISFEKAMAGRYRSAIPLEATLPAAMACSGQSLPCVGIDGSQIYPRDESPVPLAWVRALAYRSGPGVVSECGTWVTGTDWCPDSHLRQFVDAQRAGVEMDIAAGVKSSETVSLLDGGLLPWIGGYDGQENFSAVLDRYLENYRSFSPMIVAGVICNPKSRALVNLARLIEVGVDAYTPAGNGIRDVDLVRHLLPDHARTSHFIHGSSLNYSLAAAGCPVCIFYVRVGETILRVETPLWVAGNPELLDVLHSSVVQDSLAIEFPYVLAQAHNHVVISTEIADAVFHRAEAEYLRAGGKPIHPSRKQLAKGS